jgi:hypothetical protein
MPSVLPSSLTGPGRTMKLDRLAEQRQALATFAAQAHRPGRDRPLVELGQDPALLLAHEASMSRHGARIGAEIFRPSASTVRPSVRGGRRTKRYSTSRPARRIR